MTAKKKRKYGCIAVKCEDVFCIYNCKWNNNDKEPRLFQRRSLPRHYKSQHQEQYSLRDAPYYLPSDPYTKREGPIKTISVPLKKLKITQTANHQKYATINGHFLTTYCK